MNKIECCDSLEYLKKQKDFSVDINYSDPPYGLGSTVVIKPNGKPDYDNASDFMNKWDMPTGNYWEEWFKEAYRTLKYGGYCIMFGMDRQLLLFKYYASLVGFSERQSMYWYFISNFPKSADLSKNLDKNAGVERKKVEIKGNKKNEVLHITAGVGDDNNPITLLAKKYSGYKYSISPLKQTNETILIFQKPYFTKSCLHDTLAYENGDKECCCGALNIEGGRVPTNDKLQILKNNTGEKDLMGNMKGKNAKGRKIEFVDSGLGRYPAQTFVDKKAGEVLDLQSGKDKKGFYRPNVVDKQYKQKSKINFGGGNVNNQYQDTGGCSKILHKCDFEKDEHDLYLYCPKVSGEERSKGLEFDSSGIVCYHISIIDKTKLCKEKNIIPEEKLAMLLVDTGQSAIKVIEEFGTQKKNDLLWNIVKFLKNILEEYQKENGYTTKTEISWTTELRTLKLLTHLFTKEHISVVKKEKTDGINLVVNAEDFYTNQNFIKRITGLSDNAKNAVSKWQLSISVKEWKSAHPTLKPISLNCRILQLFKTPNPQKIIYPFAGSFSEVIGGIQAGFTDWTGCEISKDYIKIGEARLKYWTRQRKFLF